jgi:hypothetical protein
MSYQKEKERRKFTFKDEKTKFERALKDFNYKMDWIIYLTVGNLLVLIGIFVKLVVITLD